MAPHVGFDVEQVRDKARKDLLYLLEGVSLSMAEGAPGAVPAAKNHRLRGETEPLHNLGPWQEEPRASAQPSRSHKHCGQGLDAPRLWG